MKSPKPPSASKVLNAEIHPSKVYKIMIVDDHPIGREGVRRRIESQTDMAVSCEAGTESEALSCLEKFPCDAAVIDIRLKGRSGIDLIKQLRSQGRTFPILVLSVHDDLIYLERTLEAGAQGYIVKHEAPTLIIEALRRILAGEIYICDSMTNKFFSRQVGRKKKAEADNPLSILSDREIEILEAVGRGKTTRQISEDLILSVSTIETHKSRTKIKLGLKNVSELTVFAAKWLKGDQTT